MKRKRISELIVDIESSVDVNDWNDGNFKLWPLFRIYWYMEQVTGQIDRPSFVEKSSFIQKLKRVMKMLSDFKKIFRNVKSIYVGERTHCVVLENKWYNRFFGSFMDNDKSFLYVSKHNFDLKEYHEKNHLDYYLLFFLLKKIVKTDKEKIVDSSIYKEIRTSLLKNNVSINEDGFLKFYSNVYTGFKIYHWLLKILKPEKVLVLCYYSPSTMGLLAAASKLNIETVDMQHGGMGESHLAYSSWTKVPDEGYEVLPHTFYTWNEISASIINRWAVETLKHKAINYGNPWVQAWKNGQFGREDIKWPENVILYSMQPIDNPLNDAIINTIKKTSDKWNWWVRLHPRQGHSKEEVVKILEKHRLLDKVNLKQATSFHLPEILLHTKIHLTKFSGTAIESSLMQVPTLIIDERGAELLSDEDDYKNICFDLRDDYSDEIEKIRKKYSIET